MAHIVMAFLSPYSKQLSKLLSKHMLISIAQRTTITTPCTTIKCHAATGDKLLNPPFHTIDPAMGVLSPL